MPTLFNGDNSDSDKELKVNTDYAKNYNNWRQKEELNKLKTKYGNISGSATSDENSDTEDSSEEEEGENEMSQQFDKDFYTTLALLKKKDPKIYNQDVTFFDDTNKAQESYYGQKKQKTKKEKAVFLRDYERQIIVEREGKFSDSEDENKLTKIKDPDHNNKVTYVQEQKQLKDSFKDALQDGEEDDVDLLKPKVKSEIEKQKEDADYKEWLKGQEAIINENEQEVLKPLRDFWSNPNLDKDEKFLRDYILNNKYLDKEYTGPDVEDIHVIHDSNEDLSEDEENIVKQEEFEHKYNFRFEEPDQEFIKRYPRTMENSLRRKDTRRAQKRVEIKQRKEEEKLRKKEELKQLKALKRKEIEEKIKKLKEITGNDDIQFNDIDLDGDFDPSEHDRKMTALFNDDYYAVPEDDTKPEFPELDEELEIEDTWDDYDPNMEHNEEGYEGPHCEDPNFNMDADYDPSKSIKQEVEDTKKRKRRRKSKFAELIAKEKPKFDPNEYQSYEEYFDKYYSLDYEDMIGDIPCRFKYRKVVPNDYGLSIEEILVADDKELNKWCSLKKALQYKPEHMELNDVRMYQQKARNEALKRKILRSLYTNSEDEEEADKEETTNNLNSGESAETKKRRRKKKKKQDVSNDSSIIESDKEFNESNGEDKRDADIAQKDVKNSLQAEKRKQPEENTEQSSKKKRKVNSSEHSTKSAVQNTPRKEQGENLNNQKPDESSDKHSKKLKTKEKSKKRNNKVLDGAMRKGTKSSNTVNGDIASMNPERLKMYGINPKKLKNKLKYGKQRQ